MAVVLRVRTGDLQFVKRGARPLEQGVQRARGDFSIIAERVRQYTVDRGRGRGGERRLEPEQRIPAWVGVRRWGGCQAMRVVERLNRRNSMSRFLFLSF